MESLYFKKWLEVMSQGGVEPTLEKPDLSAIATYSGYNSTEKPPTKANNFKMKKKMNKS